MISSKRLRIVWAALVFGCGACAQAVNVADVGRFQFADAGGSGAAELSGLSWAGDHVSGTLYYAVGDETANVYPMTINVNSITGAVTAASISAPLGLKDASGVALSSGPDREGIAYIPGSGSILVSDELGPNMRRHDLTSGNTVTHITPASHAQLGVFTGTRSNFGWESLSRQSNGTVWTANEEALTQDGNVSSTSAGTTVRLQKFDNTLTPAGQWAYVTDPIAAAGITFPAQAVGTERSGVSDLLALPDGTVLVLERELHGVPLAPFGTIPQFRIRLYEVDFTGATDVSGEAALDPPSAPFTPLGKTLRWEFFSSNPLDNFEGMTLGPQLDNGDYTILLVGDNGGGASHALYALRVSGVPEPTCLGLIGIICLLATRRSPCEPPAPFL